MLSLSQRLSAPNRHSLHRDVSTQTHKQGQTTHNSSRERGLISLIKSVSELVDIIDRKQEKEGIADGVLRDPKGYRKFLGESFINGHMLTSGLQIAFYGPEGGAVKTVAFYFL